MKNNQNENRKKILHRLSRISGHVESVRRMVNGDEDPSDILMQLSAVRGAVRSAERFVLKEYIKDLAATTVETNRKAEIEKMETTIDRLIKNV